MFNKPSLFPKSAEPVVGRTSRPLAGVSPAASGVSSSAGSNSVQQAPSANNDIVKEPAQAAPTGTNEAMPSTERAVDAAGGSRLIVGPDVKLKGAEIQDCDTLVVEGRVEATMDSRVIRIAEAGAFNGKVGIDIAEIHGIFEGELTARQQLRIHATGRVSGKIRYGRILIEEGGEVSGDVQPLAAASTQSAKPQDKTATPELKPLSAVAG